MARIERKSNNRRFIRGKKECYFTKNNIEYIDYKDVNLLKKYVNDKAKIKSSKATGTAAKHQRQLAVAIKRSRHMALMPFMEVTKR